MRKFKCRFIFSTLIALFFSITTSTNAQVESTNTTKTADTSITNTVDTSLYVIKTNDGNSIIGRVLDENPRETTIKLQDNRVVILPSYIIVSRTKVSKENMIKGRVFLPNPHPSRYFYTPTALPMKKDEIYIQSIYFLSAQLQYGVTDNFSLGIATTIAGIPMFISSKYSYKIKDNHHVAIGAQVGNLTYAEPNTYLGIGFGCYTYGNAESNITIAAGYSMYSEKGYYPSGYYPDQNGMYTTKYTDRRYSTFSPAISVSGSRRLSNSLALMGEFWVLPDVNTVVGGPFLRMFFNKTATYDIGLVYLYADEFPIILPAFSYTYKFNQN
jgi:hypothetical protein